MRACVLLICALAVLSAVMTYAGCISTAVKVRNNVGLALEGTLVRESVAMYKSLDDRICDPDDSVYEYFIGLFSDSFSKLDEENGSYVLHSEDGDEIFTLKDPVLYYIVASEGVSYEIAVDFTLEMPLSFAGEGVSRVEIPMTVRRTYMQRKVFEEEECP